MLKGSRGPKTTGTSSAVEAGNPSTGETARRPR
jgi:hypothetical protein